MNLVLNLVAPVRELPNLPLFRRLTTLPAVVTLSLGIVRIILAEIRRSCANLDLLWLQLCLVCKQRDTGQANP